MFYHTSSTVVSTAQATHS